MSLSAVGAATDEGKAGKKSKAEERSIPLKFEAATGDDAADTAFPRRVPKKLTGTPWRVADLKRIPGLNPPERYQGPEFTRIFVSMDADGQSTAIKITPDGRVASGETRLTVAEKLGWEYLGVTVEDMTEAEIWSECIRENFQRQKPTVYQEAEYFWKAKRASAERAKEGHGEEITCMELARIAGRTEAHVSNLIRARERLPERILTDWRAGESKVNLPELIALATVELAKNPAKQLAAYDAGGIKKYEKKQAILAAQESFASEEGEDGNAPRKTRDVPAHVELQTPGTIQAAHEVLKNAIFASGKKASPFQEGAMRALRFCMKLHGMLLPPEELPGPAKAAKGPKGAGKPGRAAKGPAKAAKGPKGAGKPGRAAKGPAKAAKGPKGAGKPGRAAKGPATDTKV